jgi:hypothetical protein
VQLPMVLRLGQGVLAPALVVVLVLVVRRKVL